MNKSSNRHMNIFHSYTQNESRPIENNISRGFAILLQEHPALLVLLLDKIQKDSSALSALEGDNKTLADTFADLTQVADYNTAFMDLESGACDAVAIDIGVAQYQISQKGSDQYKMLDEIISSEQYGIGFKKGNDQLKDKVQATLDEMFEDGTVEEIAQKYDTFGVPGALITK